MVLLTLKPFPDFIVLSGLEADNFLKLDFNCSFGYADYCGRIANQLVELVESHQTRVIAKDEQHALN